MSEADSPNKDSGLPRSVEPVESVPADVLASNKFPEPAPEEDWQTVDFPGAMSVDAIPAAAELPATTVTHQDSEVLAALASLNPPADAEGAVPLPSTEVAADADTDPSLVQRLQQESQELRDRLAQLEQDLAQQQIELQLEMARSLHTTAAAAKTEEAELAESAPSESLTSVVRAGQAVVTPELTLAQGRVNQLFQELELAQQTAQRQQILVETLSEQLESSQERIAQLERDCALAQQRYNEQIQQLLQAETTCRDLRMRLHRQQQQTLQFKAALEKCLEMPAPSSHLIAVSDASPSTSLPAVPLAPTPLTAGLTPKNQPVRPWVAPIGQERNDADSNLPKPLSKWLKPDEVIPADTSEFESQNWLHAADDTQTAADWVDQIFTNATDPAYTPEVIGDKTGIFDLSPFLETGEIQATALTNAPTGATPTDGDISDPAKDAGLLQMLASVPLASDELVTSQPFGWGIQANNDPLWDDLAKLIEPASAADSAAVGDTAAAAIAPLLPFPNQPSLASEPTSLSGTESSVTPTPPTAASSGNSFASTSTTSTNPTSKKPLELISWTSRSQRVDERSDQRQPVTPVINAELLETDAVTPEMAASASAIDTNTTSDAADQNVDQNPIEREFVTASWPSPVVYPLRPSKKLKSLSAVDLPTFPKAR